MALSLAPDLTIQDDFQTVPKRIWLGLRYLKETEWAEYTSLARNPSFSGWGWGLDIL